MTIPPPSRRSRNWRAIARTAMRLAPSALRSAELSPGVPVSTSISTAAGVSAIWILPPPDSARLGANAAANSASTSTGHSSAGRCAIAAFGKAPRSSRRIAVSSARIWSASARSCKASAAANPGGGSSWKGGSCRTASAASCSGSNPPGRGMMRIDTRAPLPCCASRRTCTITRAPSSRRGSAGASRTGRNPGRWAPISTRTASSPGVRRTTRPRWMPPAGGLSLRST